MVGVILAFGFHEMIPANEMSCMFTSYIVDRLESGKFVIERPCRHLVEMQPVNLYSQEPVDEASKCRVTCNWADLNW
jgi:hypothetical protein